MTKHILAVQEDDWGDLKLFTIDPTTGALEFFKKTPYSDLNYDDPFLLLKSQNLIAHIDWDGVFSFFNLDGEHLYSSSSGAGSFSNAVIGRYLFNDGASDIFTGYVIPEEDNNLTIVNRCVINPILKTEVLTPLFDYSLSPFSSTSKREPLLFESTGGLPVVIIFESGEFKMWKMTSQDVWESVLVTSNQRYTITDQNNGSGFQVLNDSASSIELLTRISYQDDLYKLVIDKTTLIVTPTLIVSNAYTTTNPAIDSQSFFIQRPSASEEAMWGQNFVANTPITDPGTGVPLVLGAAGSGPTGGTSKALLLGANIGGYINSLSISNDKFNGSNTFLIDVFFDDVTTKSSIMRGTLALIIEAGKVSLYSGGDGGAVTKLAESTVTVTTGVWYQISMGYKFNTTIIRLAIDTVVEEFDIGVSSFQFGLLGYFSGGTPVPGMQGKIGGFAGTYGAYQNLVYYKPELNTQNFNATTTIEIIEFSPSSPRSIVSKKGNIIADFGRVDNDGKMFSTESSSFIDLTGIDLTYTVGVDPNNQNIDLSYNPVFTIGNFAIVIDSAIIRICDITTKATIDEYINVSDEDREQSYDNRQLFFPNRTMYSATGTVRTAQGANITDAKIILQNKDASQILKSTVSSGGVYNFECATNTPKTVIAIHSDPSKNHQIRSNIVPV